MQDRQLELLNITILSTIDLQKKEIPIFSLFVIARSKATKQSQGEIATL
jgi:hypothetical protein